MTSPKLEEKIYLTYKTRMTSEARLRRAAFLSYLMLTWYSFALIVLSLLDLSRPYTIINFSMISAAVSIATFSITLFIYGERYNERADQFRACYLKLQTLYESGLTQSEKMQKYAEILVLYENQSDQDYDEMLFDALCRGQKLHNAHGPVKLSVTKFVSVLTKRLTRAIFVLAVAILPIVFCWMWVKPV